MEHLRHRHRAGGAVLLLRRQGGVRHHAHLRGAGESSDQLGHADHLVRRQGAGQLLRGEPLQRALQRPLALPTPGFGKHRGRAFLQALGHRRQVAVPRGLRRAHGQQERRRQHHHPAAGEEPVSPRREPEQAQVGASQVPGMDHRHQARIQLLERRDHRHVPQHGGLRAQRLWHPFGGQDLLRQGPKGLEPRGECPDGRRGERPYPIQPCAQPRTLHAAPQPGAEEHGEERLYHPSRLRLRVADPHRHVAFRGDGPQQRSGHLFPRAAPQGTHRMGQHPLSSRRQAL